MKRIMLFSFMMLVIITGCDRPYAYTNVTTLLEPHQNIGVSRIVIIVSDMGNLIIRESLEDWFVKEFAEYDISAEAGYKIFSPLKSYSPQEMAALMKEHKIDAYMLVSPTPAYVFKDNRLYPYNYSTGYAIEARLYLRNGSNPIWEADSLTSYYHGLVDFNTTFYSLTKEIVYAYKADLSNQKVLNQTNHK